jgi:hypothetical protein
MTVEHFEVVTEKLEIRDDYEEGMIDIVKPASPKRASESPVA